jgi:hypothetical protein
MKHRLSTTFIRNALLGAAMVTLASCATFNKPGSDAKIENLRTFHLSFVDEFAVPDKAFDATAFDARVQEGNAKFEALLAEEKFKARIPALKLLQQQFQADAKHLRSQASRGKVTPALGAEMKKDINDNYNQVLGQEP